MANQKHLDILMQGVEVWNQWRKRHAKVKADLRGVELRLVELSGVNLRSANLSGADLSGANLSYANLSRTDLSYANLNRADLRADLSGANLSRTDLSYVNFSRANLSTADFSEAKVGWTIFGNVDLKGVKGLEIVKHDGPSTIGIDTIIKSHGKIPEIFLREAGIPLSIIEQIPSLVGSLKPIEFYSCFLSYSSLDQDFADRLYADLQAARVRCWFASHDMKMGDRYRDRIEESIRVSDKLLLILSKNVIASTWVEEEVEKAMDKERQGRSQGHKQTVLFPIKLDDAIMQTTTAWAADVRRMWHIGDFTGWHDYTCYQHAFTRLLRDLKSEA